MKARLMLAVPLMVGVALAQSPSGSSQPQSGSAQPQSSTPQTQSASPSGSGAATTAGAPSTSGSHSGDIPQMKTMTYRGTLVDLSCGSTAASTGARASDTSSASAAGSPSTAGSQPVSSTAATSTSTNASSTNANSANRSTADSSNCPVSASSSQFGLKMDNGQVVRFDLVGNQRAQDALKNNKKLSSSVSANKPLQVKISGVLQGDKLIVSQIH